MPRHRRLALTAGLLYLVTFVTSIPALLLKTPALRDPGHVARAGVAWAAVLEVLLAIAAVGTAVVLYPVASRVSQTAALGFVAARVAEAGAILIGVICLLSLTTVAGTAASGPAGAAVLVALHDWAFLLGPGFVPAVNGLCLGLVLWRGRLVPRAIPLLGLMGAPLLALSATATLFGALDQVSAVAGLLALPIAGWEFAVGVWLTLVGFRPAAVAALGEGARGSAEFGLTSAALGQR